MANWYCVVKDDIIIEVYHTSDGEVGVQSSTQVKDYDNIIKVPDGFEGYPGLNVNELDGKSVKPIVQRINEGYRTIPEGFEIVDEQLVKIPDDEPEVDQEVAEYNQLISNTLINMAVERLGDILDQPMTDEEYDLTILDMLKRIAEERIEEDFIRNIEE